ncbi:hypothetical protein SAY86_020360 [Trapa natans]|uniref:Pectinesterase n=1 Tax=Trapa natans TaxID=22666 RepID=A0AAN7LMH9_TRANT|nr:hypothetical protein SAY86_020360 [Trapa natans]
MDSVSSTRGYGKVDGIEDGRHRGRMRRWKLTICISSILLIAVVVAIIVGVVLRKNGGHPESHSETGLTSSASINAVCGLTMHPETCFSSISKSQWYSDTTDPEEIFKISLLVAMEGLVSVVNYTDSLMRQVGQNSDPVQQSPLIVCQEALEDAVYMLNQSIFSTTIKSGKLLSPETVDDLRTWLSTVLSDQETCLDAFEDVNWTDFQKMALTMTNSTELISNSLAIITKLLGYVSKFKIPMHRRLLSFSDCCDGSGFPTWLSAADRRLLQATNPTPNLVIAQDGSGSYTTINSALNAIPSKSPTRFVIYVKAGIYKENVILDKTKWNVMIYGDGKTRTIVTGSKNYVDGTATSKTGTFIALGQGFFAKDMGFRNTAGPEKHQAVAFRSGSDKSVMYRCYFDSYQDTLYAHTNRQFYRECDIIGSVDFIFGYSAVVIQNSTILPRQPMPNQYNTITAQGKFNPNLKSGISIQDCKVIATENLIAKTYLGRPWKNHSTTVFMQSFLDSLIDPKGWVEWFHNVTPPNTIFYGEYQNTGPGSNTIGRVTWPGYKPALTSAEAGGFTVNSFIQGSTWLPVGVPYKPYM